ncbi:cysteine-rich and transmembrane domain-containing protein WIH2-like [Selaginella moellendorffii]|uniref:cysteine-rich and transmembrane domain-containing protein WIH2-like n=1 Tax=Selaginella moellendorffii TaxID=88036 RepID=UPI000D1C65BF|nr:cysteine-rich and transmembrane domain-containing protein WIH2-like [Selaginella moellendorffii]|eukprot:XP_024527091.1 cysteine-rich and transmembrane domain-containing protein WIH2-like [Selaginella moellendorffii]
MSYYDQKPPVQAPPPQGYGQAYPPQGYPPQGCPPQGYPPAGYPVQQPGYKQEENHQNNKGPSFIQGCLGALCCCCLLGACF